MVEDPRKQPVPRDLERYPQESHGNPKLQVKHLRQAGEIPKLKGRQVKAELALLHLVLVEAYVVVSWIDMERKESALLRGAEMMASLTNL